MGAISCFGCFGGQKKDPSPESSEPARQVLANVSDEKTVSSSPTVSNDSDATGKEDVKSADPQDVSQTEEAVLTSSRVPSPVLDPSIDLPPSPAVGTASTKDPSLTEKTKELQAYTSPSTHDRVTSPRNPPISQHIRSASSISSLGKVNSAGSSLKQVSTKATTPPRTPVETEARGVLATRLSAEIQNTRITINGAPLPLTEAEPLPTPQIERPQPLDDIVRLKAVESIEALPQSPPPSTGTRPTLELKTTSPLPSPRLHRPSFEDDTPVTPLTPQPIMEGVSNPNVIAIAAKDTSSISLPQRPSVNRVSTVPTESTSLTKSKPERRKSRLSRFLSVSSSSSKDTEKTKERKRQRQSRFRISGVAIKEREEEESAAKLPVLKDIDGELDRGQVKEKTSLEKEVEKETELLKVEGRKWKEEGDNDSLFCY